MRSKILLSVLLIAGVLMMAYAAEDVTKEERDGLLRHVVCFKFNEDSSEADVQKVVDAFAALEQEIPFIVDFEYGTNVSPEDLNQGFTHCFVATFKTAKDRDIYLDHPEHLEFVEVLKPHLDKVFVIDYWTK